MSIPLDCSWKELRAVDEKIAALGYGRFLDRDYFLSLLAFAGEQTRARARGEWRFRKDPKSGVWEPYIVSRRGTYFALWESLFDVCFDDELTGIDLAIYAAVTGGGYIPEPGFWGPDDERDPAQATTAPFATGQAAEGGMLQSGSAEVPPFQAGSAGGTHILQGAISSPDAFLLGIPGLIRALAEKLGIEAEALDGSMESLGDLEERVWELGGEKFSEPAHLLPLITYLGEVIRRQVGGEWRVRYEAADGVWEPYVVDPEGRFYNPWLTPSGMLLEEEGPGSLEAALIAEIYTRRGSLPDEPDLP